MLYCSRMNMFLWMALTSLLFVCGPQTRKEVRPREFDVLLSSVLYAPFAKPILRFISSYVSSKLPTYLHFFQSFGPDLVIVYFSVFVWFMNRFLSFRIAGISSSMILRICIPVDAQPISSAYCWSMVKKFYRPLALYCVRILTIRFSLYIYCTMFTSLGLDTYIPTLFAGGACTRGKQILANTYIIAHSSFCLTFLGIRLPFTTLKI